MLTACGPGRLGHAETYRAEIHYQRGQHLYTRVDGLVGVTWGRKLDDYSEASITVSKSLAGADCCGKLGNIHPWGHELTLWRDDELVWQGPIVQAPSEFRDRFEIEARDMLAWLDRRRNPKVYNWAAPSTDNPNPTPPADAQTIIDTLIRDAFAEHDPGFLRSPTGGYRSGFPAGVLATYQAMQIRDSIIGNGVRDLIDHGIDMYTVGRHILFRPERIARSNKPHRLTEDDFLGDLEVRRLGLDTATRGIVVGSQPRNPVAGGNQPAPNTPPPVGVWPRPPAGVDGFYGLIEHGHTSQAATTQAAVDSLARLVVSYGYPAPLAVIVPSSTQLSPNAPVTIRELVPGRVVQVHLPSYCTPVQQDFVINEVEVTVDVSDNGMTEQVQLSLASRGTPTGTPTESPGETL